MSALDQALDELADRVAARVAERLRSGQPGWIDQASSPLGSRRHCSAARRRHQRGEAGVARVGRRWMLSPEALRDELQRCNTTGTPTDPAPAGAVREGLERKLALLKGGR